MRYEYNLASGCKALANEAARRLELLVCTRSTCYSGVRLLCAVISHRSSQHCCRLTCCRAARGCYWRRLAAAHQRETRDECEHNKSRGQAPGHARRALRSALRLFEYARALREMRRVDGVRISSSHNTGRRPRVGALPGRPSSSIPMGFEFEKEAVGENPQVTDEFAAAVKRG